MRAELEAERERVEERVGAEEAAVFEAQIQFLDGSQIIERVGRAIETGLPAEHAVERGFEAGIEQFEGMEGRMAERADDLTGGSIEHALSECGVMIETPASVLMALELAARVDFLSIGTNDLAQYTMAASRKNKRVAGLRDPRHPPVLRAIRRTVAAGHANDP